ncbi:hypothetical protein BCR42DRAFT_440660 [Absidia repens]|uniref:GATA-type domain-containing protein n=1 Tax=Absidia repens TaxID=90262 RepID=A0A1X2I7N9_9FUNG|nr:hypothetical protein BCR42DRAFT_440660 [Absidia repens]
MNVSELCATPTKATNGTNQAMESYSLRETDQDISNNDTAPTPSLPVNRFTLPPLSQRLNLQQRLPSLVAISSSFEDSTEDSIEEAQTADSTKNGEGLEVKQLIEKCSTLCNDLARYKTWQKGLEKDREAIFDFVTHTAHDILDSLVAMQQQQDAVVSNEAEYEMIRQARNWKENRKPKYRRRSKRNMIGQQCHSCHTSETPEWRRGPDGARTLCNACGLHYSKLLRKESVTVASYKLLANGPPISSSSDGTNKVDQQLQYHHQQEDQQQELQNRQNDEQHKHPNHYIQPPPPPPPSSVSQQHHHHHHHHHHLQHPSVPHHHQSHHQLSQANQSLEDQHQYQHQHQHQHQN